jgi:flagellar basal-body rod protein FlgF
LQEAISVNRGRQSGGGRPAGPFEDYRSTAAVTKTCPGNFGTYRSKFYRVIQKAPGATPCGRGTFGLWHRRCSASGVNVSLYQAAAGLDANAQWQDMVADNLASSSIPGYKRRELSLAAMQAGLLPTSSPNGASDSFVIPRASGVTNFENGEMKATNVNTDVAIDGKGFFGVQLPNGTTAYTRDGEFHVSTTGQLVTKEGYAVLGGSGPIQLDRANHSPIAIDGAGNVSQNHVNKGKIQLTDFNKTSLLNQISGAYFLANNPHIKTESTTATLRQGYLEGSNSSTVNQMVGLLTAMRGFESSQKLIQMEDERLGHVISDIGNPSSS